jgi:hypothetical protein
MVQILPFHISVPFGFHFSSLSYLADGNSIPKILVLSYQTILHHIKVDSSVHLHVSVTNKLTA